MLLLASNSPRRRQLLALGGWSFDVSPTKVDERPYSGENPRAYVLRIAERKARACEHPPGEVVVIAADTTVVDGERILGKPADEREAASMLLGLRGRTHQVLTALAVLPSGDSEILTQEIVTEGILTDCCATDVPMREYSHEEMYAYIATGDPMDKAGAYAIQHPVFHPVEELNGCYANVMGLPLCHLARTLAKISVGPKGDIAAACQDALAYDCPVYSQVLHAEV